MSTTTRKQFIKTTAMSSLAIIAGKIAVFGKPFSYRFLKESNDNVIYYEKNNAEYETLRKGFNKRINRFPKIIALCKNTNGVSEAVKFAITKNLPVTVKSGGHCMEGFSCLDGGMVINLSLMQSIGWVDKNTIKLGPACTLKKLYEELIPKGKYLPGGSCQSVAIGGLTLGGGYGLLSRNFGLTCDSLVEMTMVDGKGNIVNSQSDPELLWACKGGGNGNFGAVTEMKFKIHEAPATLKSYKFRTQNCTVSKAKEICKNWFALSKTLPVSCFSAFIFNGKTVYILLTNIRKNTTEADNFIATFKAQSTKYTEGTAKPLAEALKAYYAESSPITFKNASAGLYRSYAEIEPVLEDVFNVIVSTPGILYQVNTLGGNIQNQDFEQSSSFAHRDCIYFSELQAYWETGGSTNKFLSKFESIQQLFANQGIKAQYRNYPDINFKNAVSLYYGKNLSRLKTIKNKYDALNLFNGIQSLQII
jgi:hypothetical protein